MATRFFMGAFETGMFPGCEWHPVLKLVRQDGQFAD